ncbi:hypothetical protein P170DRAFT_503110 [Aspergillus steynii IBT 23096]|uniref:Uncharacterized protein n=1 Tax=Aspergillus steynii IBT 23096 TaxID=1392250 RepID=A0A2I2FUT4_9EURO|nr:uncharacterized protein P170DRAFT_503110 [Aspergillus steynii IBT 23096]PLB44400.1 hypothetical protein P170DRAFT_503110 [Aspergillus steynii IBT 23096]
MDTYTDLKNLQDIAHERYPELSAAEAFIALHRDVALGLRPILKATPEITKLYGLCTSNPAAILAGEGASMLRSIISELSAESYEKIFGAHTASGSLTTEEDTKAAQSAAEILQKWKSGTLGFSSPIGTATADASLVDGNVQKATSNATAPVRGPRDTKASALEVINYNECVQTALVSIQAIQGYQAVQALNAIADHLGDSNAITVSGSGGPNGFAQHVYDLVKTKILDIHEAKRESHRFFIYNPDTMWYPAFGRLTRDNPLPPQFVDKGDHLDHICLFMREARTKLNEADPEHGRDITFHLLIPTWQKLGFREPFHFPEDLYPLQIEGLKNGGGKEMVEMNLPEAPIGLLHGVANALDPRYWNKIAEGATTAASFILGVLGMMFKEEVYGLFREKAPRVLGSNMRLSQKARFNIIS